MTAMKRVGYAVVGLGSISEHAVLPAFKHSKKSRLVAVVSGDAKKAKRLGAKFHADEHFTYDTFEQCLRNPQVEAVYIATNNSTHLEFTLQAARAGKHVLCEKPLANTVQECQRMVDECQRNRVKLMTAYRKYFEPASVEFKKLLGSGKLGRLKLIHTAFTINLDPRNTWHLDPRLAGGGSLVDLGVYCVNTVRWLTGEEPVEATAHSWTVDPARFGEVDESITFQLLFPEGLVMQGSSSFSAAQASFLQVHGEKGWAGLNPAYAFDEERRMFGKVGAKWFEKRFKRAEEFHLELDHLADCIRANRNPGPDGIAGLRDVAVMQAIYQAAKLNQPVAIHLPQ
jgi:predicted dehydrogenase